MKISETHRLKENDMTTQKGDFITITRDNIDLQVQVKGSEGDSIKSNSVESLLLFTLLIELREIKRIINPEGMPVFAEGEKESHEK